MNRIYKSVWDELSGTCIAVSECVAARGKRSSLRSSGRTVAGGIFSAVLSFALIPHAFAQCSASGGTIGSSVSDGCTVSTPGSTLSILSPATFTGWTIFSGANTSLVINSGAEFNGDQAPAGNTTSSFVAVTADGWSLTNNGSLANASATGYDLVGLRAAGSYSITNNGTISAGSTSAGSNAIEAVTAGITLHLVNTGTINDDASAAINVTGGGATTIDNQSTGLISAFGRAITAAGDLNLTNRGTIQTRDASGFAIANTGASTVRNSGTISGAGGAAQGVISFGGAADTLILEPTSVITGYVDAGGGTDTLVLGGTGAGTFDVGSVGPTQQYRAFETFEKRESGTWTLTGTNSAAQAQNWQLLEGTLRLASGASLAAGSTIENPSTATGPVTLEISGALLGAGGDGIIMSGNYENHLILGAGATFGGRTMSLSAPRTTLTGPTPFPNGVALTGGTLEVGDGGAGTGGSITGPIANNGGTLLFHHSDDLVYPGVISGSGTVGQIGTGTLTFTGVNTYTGPTQINAGTLQGGVANAFANSSAVAIASGATLDLNNFDQIANNLSGAGKVTLGTAALTANNTTDTLFSGPISGDGQLIKTGAASLTLTGPSTYSGPTTVLAGTLKTGLANALSPNSAYIVGTSGTIDSSGLDQAVASLDNAGTVKLLSSTPGRTFTVTGPYVGRGGTLLMGTALGDSASASDRLVLDGPGASASGTTKVQITNIAGLGALTAGNGIEVISARNGATTTAQTTKDAFALGGGATLPGIANGSAVMAAPHIDVGAYEYRLYAADANGAGENWYLRSTTNVVAPPAPPTVPPTTPPVGEVAPPPQPPVVVPTYRAEVPMVSALASQSRQGDAAMLGNLHLRMGDDDATRAASGVTPNQLDRRAWGRAIYTDVDIRQQGIAQSQSSGSLSGFQAGMDLWSDSSWRAGLYAGYLEGGVDVTGNAHGEIGPVGSNRLKSRYLGGYATWTDANGCYADIVLQGGSHRYELRPDLNPQVSGKGSSLTASIEVGRPFAIAEGWTIEPQAQLGYQKSTFDDLQLGGALVQQQTDAGLIGRLGVRVKGDMMTGVGRLQPYGRVNLYYAGSGTDVARFVTPAAVTEIPTGTGHTSAEVAAGMTLALNSTTSLYGEVGHIFDVSGNARVRSSVQGSLGVRVRWD
ncbi:autotransporter outer membrane beta-barrel domain-containing protein [Variovorax sp. GT1P44]|uniref:autotransporter outer membrane beta-barrel domain-containing protein n=1 Tax=Variovorax sp. GT1P44 TaxID=3443742 RepID=UPI003F45A469